MSAHAELGGIAAPPEGAAVIGLGAGRRSPVKDRLIGGGILVGAVAMYGLFGALIYVAVTALV
jgi:hypothetical protein